MKLICPGCGAVGSADSWINDTNCREALFIITSLPAPLPKITLNYLSLFRPGKQSLTWKKALRLASEIQQLTSTGYVSIQGQIDRNCPPRTWAQAMEQMVEQRSRLNLPMPNHNYLKKVAHDLAAAADYQAEKTKYVAPVTPTGSTTAKKGDISLSPLAKAYAEYDKKNANGGLVKGALNDISTVVKGMD